MKFGEFNHLLENLNYSAQRLVQVWPSRFPSLPVAIPYAGNPEKLANFIYANRLGNGPPDSGDGWKYRGRGLIQLTGRGNYQQAATGIGRPLVDQPDLLLQPDVAARSAAFFWKSHGLNELADDRSGDDDNADFQMITIRINGGTKWPRRPPGLLDPSQEGPRRRLNGRSPSSDPARRPSRDSRASYRAGSWEGKPVPFCCSWWVEGAPGLSRAACGTRPGRRLPLRRLQRVQAVTMFVQQVRPPRERGTR